MLLRKVYRFRMRPTKTQEVALYRMAGARRFVYNWALDGARATTPSTARASPQETVFGVDGAQKCAGDALAQGGRLADAPTGSQGCRPGLRCVLQEA